MKEKMELSDFLEEVEAFEEAEKFLKLIVVPKNSVYTNNTEILGQIPGIPDLCLVAKIVNPDLEIVGNPKAVTYEHWSVSPEEVFAIAKENSQKKLAIESIESITGVNAIAPMMVVTDGNPVETGFFGGAAIFFLKNAKKVSKLLGGDFYIIPSSVHETICLSTNLPEDHTSQEIKETILEVNRSLPIRERLSDHLYMYHTDTCTYSVV